MKNLPTAFQRNALWMAITALSITVIGGLSIGFIYLCSKVIGFLQPILIPFAVAGVLAYLLDPAVAWLGRRSLNRQPAVLLVFAVFTITLGSLCFWIVPKVAEQTANLARKIPGYTVKARNATLGLVNSLEKDYGISLLPKHGSPTDVGPPAPSAIPPVAPPSTTAPVLGGNEAAPPTAETAPDKGADVAVIDASAPVAAAVAEDNELQSLLTGDWMATALPSIIKNTWNFVRTSVGGFLGMFGFLLSMIIVPLYLYYFLVESARIKQRWSDYLPLRTSAFKDELVSCLTEINSYLVAFFRGQLFVSMINGVATGIGLVIIGLDFGLVIGLALCFLGIIPYLGIVLCWIPAVIIGAAQGGSALIPGNPWWALPLAVTAVFVIVQQIDGFFITPRVVGEAVGLHPMTVIASVLIWTLLLGGLLGAILAIPLTASVKVLFQRYIWRARIASRRQMTSTAA